MLDISQLVGSTNLGVECENVMHKGVKRKNVMRKVCENMVFVFTAFSLYR